MSEKVEKDSVLRKEQIDLWRMFQLQHPFVEAFMIVIFAIVIGIIGGLGAIVFRYLIDFFTNFFSNTVANNFLQFGSYGYYFKVLLPAMGLLIVGVISNYFAKEVKGHGVPQILESLALRGGKINPKVSFFGILAPAITIGAGGSVGQEGPIALIGASFGSVIGQILKLPEKYLTLFLACGSAAGIAATFNAPIAGAFFGLEVILGSYAMGSIVPVFISAITGTVFFTSIMGKETILPTPNYAMTHPSEILVMILLGVIAGFFALSYTRGLSFIEEIFDRWNISFGIKAIIGGLLVGIIGLAFPEVLGVGYQTMKEVLLGNVSLISIVFFLFFKYIATLVTIGAGGSGGVFAPSLYLGVMVGGIYGNLVKYIFPSIISNPWMYGVIGMGAIFAASAQAPLTASMIILEITGDYHIATGVMTACAISYLIHGSLIRDSMYTVKLTKRGIEILRGTDIRTTERIPVKSAMKPLNHYLYTDDTIEKATRLFMDSKADLLVVLNKNDEMEGIITHSNLRGANELPNKEQITLKDIVQRNVRSISAKENLEDAMRLFSFFGVKTLPVVHPENSKKALGILTHADVINAYSTHTLHSMEATSKINALTDKGIKQNGGFKSFIIPENSSVVGKAINELGLPEEYVLVSIMRKDKIIVPHGNTILKPYDTLLVFAVPAKNLGRLNEFLS